MNSQQFVINNWYAAKYPSGYSIIFQAIADENGSYIFCRKDREIVETLPVGYNDIISYGELEPEYE